MTKERNLFEAHLEEYKGLIRGILNALDAQEKTIHYSLVLLLGLVGSLVLVKTPNSSVAILTQYPWIVLFLPIPFLFLANHFRTRDFYIADRAFYINNILRLKVVLHTNESIWGWESFLESRRDKAKFRRFRIDSRYFIYLLPSIVAFTVFFYQEPLFKIRWHEWLFLAINVYFFVQIYYYGVQASRKYRAIVNNKKKS